MYHYKVVKAHEIETYLREGWLLHGSPVQVGVKGLGRISSNYFLWRMA